MSFRSQYRDATRCQSQKVYLYPKPVDFRKSIDGVAALVELDMAGNVMRVSRCDALLHKTRHRG
jgi:hypothetical protein